MKRYLPVALLALAPPLSACAQGIALTIEGLRNDHGHVVVGIFDTARAFDRLRFDKAVNIATVPARKGSVALAFPALTSGPYAIFAFHDENDDRDINHQGNFLLEGIGATGAPDRDDHPGFAEAAFPPGALRVVIHYDR